MSEEFRRIYDYFMRKKGRALGLLIGFILGWGVMKYGFLKVLFLAICAGVGYLFGRMVDDRRTFDDMIDRIFSYRGRTRR